MAAIAAWAFWPVEHSAEGSDQREFQVQCDFARFRQILVRKNPTKAIVAHGGMELISESIEGLNVDTSQDDQPLLNAIRGQSRTEVDATKTLTVHVNNPQIESTDLVLRQHADIDQDRVRVETRSTDPQGSIQRYETTLEAVPDADGTRVSLSVQMVITVRVPRLFTGTADREVQRSAETGLAEQQDALTALVEKYASDLLMLPEFN
ncbi:hypothetical protein FYK55_13900 [Roseiconus nitratireducens]|uniref:Uncharacterized protein n=2 Tax=Roseiconus nitratireducens TaxID=2605748 RepID=A0A5M6D5M4_9BACT|nr:hypothetical protein FYK55_13900 [Roseiconus nitratireducens]